MGQVPSFHKETQAYYWLHRVESMVGKPSLTVITVLIMWTATRHCSHSSTGCKRDFNVCDSDSSTILQHKKNPKPILRFVATVVFSLQFSRITYRSALPKHWTLLGMSSEKGCSFVGALHCFLHAADLVVLQVVDNCVADGRGRVKNRNRSHDQPQAVQQR